MDDWNLPKPRLALLLSAKPVFSSPCGMVSFRLGVPALADSRREIPGGYRATVRIDLKQSRNR
jgi:hypothetical protein